MKTFQSICVEISLYETRICELPLLLEELRLRLAGHAKLEEQGSLLEEHARLSQQLAEAERKLPLALTAREQFIERGNLSAARPASAGVVS